MAKSAKNSRKKATIVVKPAKPKLNKADLQTQINELGARVSKLEAISSTSQPIGKLLDFNEDNPEPEAEVHEFPVSPSNEDNDLDI